jgi:hypothetical protein
LLQGVKMNLQALNDSFVVFNPGVLNRWNR